MPVDSGLLSVEDDHDPPDAVVSAFATSASPSKTCTKTFVFSLAVPENDGTVWLDRAGGPESSVTVGGSVLTSKSTELLMPSGLPRLETSVANALNECFPVDSAGLSGLVVHLPPLAVAVAVATWFWPSKTWTVTFVGSLAVPENVGAVSFEGVTG